MASSKREDQQRDDAVITSLVTHKTDRSGFLPFPTNTFDRVFISIISFIAISLLWMRFIEAFIPLVVSTILSLILAVIIVRRG
jgi:predicted small integral membrane protein